MVSNFDTGGIGQGIGSVGQAGAQIYGSYTSAKAQEGANQTNMDIAKMTNSFNAEQAREARDYSTYMSNSAYTRAVADMKNAGLNPMLAYQQGGASTPSSPSASGVSTRVEPASAAAGIAEGFSRAGPSALALMNSSKDLDSKDAAIAATKAQALASVAQANNANASAKATEAGMPTISARASVAAQEAEATRSEAGYRKTKADIDKQYAPVDAVTNRVVQGIDGVSSAVSIGKMVKSIRNMGREENRREDRHLRDQGHRGSSNVN